MVNPQSLAQDMVIQDLLSVFAVLSSCVDPLIYGSYLVSFDLVKAMKNISSCRCCHARNNEPHDANGECSPGSGRLVTKRFLIVNRAAREEQKSDGEHEQVGTSQEGSAYLREISNIRTSSELELQEI